MLIYMKNHIMTSKSDIELVEHAKRDKILEIEALMRERKKWDVKVKRNGCDKKFITFPYPYVNGTLHLGHAYTISKAMFSAEFYRLLGYNVLFPFSFHGTGMPIVASAAKLEYELKSYELQESDDTKSYPQ